jgi:hypothetical protein
VWLHKREYFSRALFLHRNLVPTQVDRLLRSYTRTHTFRSSSGCFHGQNGGLQVGRAERWAHRVVVPQRTLKYNQVKKIIQKERRTQQKKKKAHFIVRN